METRFLLHGLKIEDKTKEYILKKIDTIEKMIDFVEFADVEIEQDKKGLYRVEVAIKTSRNGYRADEVQDTIEASIDIIEEELKNQIRSKKEKLTTLSRRGGRSIKKKMVIDDSARF